VRSIWVPAAAAAPAAPPTQLSLPRCRHVRAHSRRAQARVRLANPLGALEDIEAAIALDIRQHPKLAGFRAEAEALLAAMTPEAAAQAAAHAAARLPQAAPEAPPPELPPEPAPENAPDAALEAAAGPSQVPVATAAAATAAAEVAVAAAALAALQPTGLGSSLGGNLGGQKTSTEDLFTELKIEPARPAPVAKIATDVAATPGVGAVAALLESANAAAGAKRYSEAAEMYAQYISACPNDQVARVHAAMCMAISGNVSGGLTALAAAAAITNPSRAAPPDTMSGARAQMLRISGP
jgi:hypothetical protein